MESFPRFDSGSPGRQLRAGHRSRPFPLAGAPEPGRRERSLTKAAVSANGIERLGMEEGEREPEAATDA